MHRLNRLCDEAIRKTFRKMLDDNGGDPRDLSDEDILVAAGQGEQPFLDETNLPATRCADKAWERALHIKTELITAYDNAGLSDDHVRIA